MIAQERGRATPRTFRVWHQGWPGKPLSWVKDPPGGPGRYHRAGGRPTWYGSTTARGAWAEFFRHFEDETVSPFEFFRRLGRADYTVFALDLSSTRVRAALGVTADELTADDLSVCQMLADLAADAGFEAVRGPSGALAGERTLAVFGPAILADATGVIDRGSQTAPRRLVGILRQVRLPASTAAWLGSRYDTLAVWMERGFARPRSRRRR